jgi:apolipoprotein D and lipocalin family protein
LDALEGLNLLDKHEYIAIMKPIYLVAILVCIAAITVSAQSTDPAKQPLTPVASINIERYQGTWHQLALYPNRFQKACASNTRATYALLGDGQVKVTNQCRNTEGKEVQAIGFARAANTPSSVAGDTTTTLSPPKLQVRFAPQWLTWLPMVWGDYWVIQLAPDYRYAVVGEPRREYLWILARDTQLSSEDWHQIETRLKEQGYDSSKLVREKHLR